MLAIFRKRKTTEPTPDVTPATIVTSWEPGEPIPDIPPVWDFCCTNGRCNRCK